MWKNITLSKEDGISDASEIDINELPIIDESSSLTNWSIFSVHVMQLFPYEVCLMVNIQPNSDVNNPPKEYISRWD